MGGSYSADIARTRVIGGEPFAQDSTRSYFVSSAVVPGSHRAALPPARLFVSIYSRGSKQNDVVVVDIVNSRIFAGARNAFLPRFIVR